MTYIQNSYELHQVFKSSSLDIFMVLKLYLVLTSCQGENQKYSYVTFDDQNSKYIFASKGTQAVYLNPNLQ